KPETLEFPELRRIILVDARRVVMHQTLDASVAALVGELPAVAPLAEAALLPEPEGEAAPAEAAEAADVQLVDELRRGLEETIERLRELLDRLERLERLERDSAR
ncbi:MAG: hypothetical protein JSU87_03155, partial [Gemmatimonadota bacterium]